MMQVKEGDCNVLTIEHTKQRKVTIMLLVKLFKYVAPVTFFMHMFYLFRLKMLMLFVFQG